MMLGVSAEKVFIDPKYLATDCASSWPQDQGIDRGLGKGSQPSIENHNARD
jgi:hypothetical protein